MLFNKTNLEKFEQLCFHDAELKEISIDYFSHSASIVLQDGEERTTLSFFHMQSFSITEFEPWGSGMYVNRISTWVGNNEISEKMRLRNDECLYAEAILVEILLNSGDTVNILAAAIKIQT